MTTKHPEHEQPEHEHAAEAPGASQEGAPPADLAAELEKATARAEDLSERWQRTQADFINFKRRSEQEKGELTKLANLILITRLLPLADDFERAFGSLPRELYALSWVEGIALIHRKLQLILENEGLKPIEALGKNFNPNEHEAVVVEEGLNPHEGKVVAELQRGYKLHDRVVRPTLVKVGHGPVETTKE